LMKILILNRDYPSFLANLYASTRGLSEATYAEQLAARNASLFGVADFYSHGFAAAGHSAQETHVNNSWLQSAWARENGLRIAVPATSRRPVTLGRGVLAGLSPLKGVARRALLPVVRRFLPRQIRQEEERILAAQIEQMKPDIILNQEMSYVRTRCLSRIVSRGTKIVGQIASALPMGEDFRRYDLIVSSLPNMVQHFKSAGLRAAVNSLAFDPRVLEKIPQPALRDVEVSFVGSLSADHGTRVRLIEALAQRVPLKVWGNGVDQLPKSSPIRPCFQGEAWGAQMYGVLRRSRITINHHIDLAAGYSNNMRLYEATGCGALMVVDRGRNLAEIFEPNTEVVAYSSTEECVEAVEHMLSDKAACREIAVAGQRRTLSEHTYARRTRELSELLLRL
jgi:spore maturation protein CgeB